MTTARNTAMCILLAALGVGLVLSVLTHVIHEPFGGMSYVEYGTLDATRQVKVEMPV